MTDALDDLLARSAIRLDPTSYAPRASDARRLAPIDAALAAARVIFLGETNHFVHEKVDFRLWWIERIARLGRSFVVAEELGASDGRDIARYLDTGDTAHLDAAATFGDKRHERADRDDRPTGILRASFDAYPTALFKAEQARFYRGLRKLAPSRFHGYDIDAVGVGYDDLRRERHRAPALSAAFWPALERIDGESLGAETARLARAFELIAQIDDPVAARLRDHLRSMIETNAYTALAHPAKDYESLRPAMAYREDLLKRRVDALVDSLARDEVLVLMAHAFHLAKDDRRIGDAGVGPGGGRVASLGHHLVQERGLCPFSAWLVYGEGEDSQPFPDLPKRASFPGDTLNRRLAALGVPCVVPVAADAFERDVGLGHLYNHVVPVHLPSEADAIFFVPRVTRLRA